MSKSLPCCTLYPYIRNTRICADLTCKPGMLQASCKLRGQSAGGETADTPK